MENYAPDKKSLEASQHENCEGTQKDTTSLRWTQKFDSTAELVLQSILVLSMSENVKPNGARNSIHFSSDSKANSDVTKLTGNS